MRRIDQKVKKLQDRFPLIEGICRLPNNRGGIHLGNSAEGGEITDGEYGADYFGEGRGDYPWIHPDLEKAVNKLGYIIEWQDAGTLVAYPKIPLYVSFNPDN